MDVEDVDVDVDGRKRHNEETTNVEVDAEITPKQTNVNTIGAVQQMSCLVRLGACKMSRPSTLTTCRLVLAGASLPRVYSFSIQFPGMVEYPNVYACLNKNF